MSSPRLSRRRMFFGVPCTIIAASIVDALWIEPHWLKIQRVRLAQGKPSHRLVHFSDLHYKGDKPFAEKVVRAINRQSPDFVCFTGDLVGDPVDKPEYLNEALGILSEIRSPLYGVPGNHEYWSRASFPTIARTFSATDGAWLMDQQVRTHDGHATLTGSTCQSNAPAPLQPDPQTRNILLLHYPAWVKRLAGGKYDLILAGHSHGGQVRLPFIGPPIPAHAVEEYDKGLFQTPYGPLYVNPGIGWFAAPIRFRCRPEITVFEI